MSEEEFLTVGEIAERFKLIQQTVRNWIEDGKLPAIRIGPRRVRVRRGDLNAFIEENSSSPRQHRTSYDDRISRLEQQFIDLAAALEDVRTRLG